MAVQCRRLGSLILLAVSASSAIAQPNIYTTTNDLANSASIRSDGGVNLGGNATAERRVGSSAAPNVGLVNLYLFPLPSEEILEGEVSLEFSFSSIRLIESTDYNADVYGLGYISGATTPTIDPNWYYSGPELDQRNRADLGTGSTGTITRIFDDFLTPTSNFGRIETGPSAEVKTFLQSLYDDDAVAGDYAVIRVTADEIVDDESFGRTGTGYHLGIDNNANLLYSPAMLNVGPLPDAADTFGGSAGLVNDPILDTYRTGYGFAGNWKGPDNALAANATIGRPTIFEPDQPEPIAVTTDLGTFDGGYTGARITGDTDFVNSPLRRELATPADDEVYFRFIVRAETGFDDDDLVGLWLDDAEGGDETDHTQNGVMLGIRNGGEVFASIDGVTTAAAATINEAEDNLLIGRLYEASQGSGLNMLDFWLNPDSTNESPLGTVTLGSNGSSAMTHVGFMTTPTTELEDSYLVDAFALAGSAEQIGFVEVSTFAWSGNISGDWHNPANWEFDAIPSANSHTAVFGAAITSPQTIFTNEPTTVKVLRFDTVNTVAIAGTGVITLDAASGNAKVDVLQGTHQLQAELSLAADTDVATSAGTQIDFNNAIHLNGNTLSATGNGQVNINHSATGGTVTSSATLGTAGSSVLSNLNSTGVLDIDIGGTGTGAFDAFIVTGAANIAGTTIDVQLVDGFTLAGNEIFTILTASTLDAAGVTIGGPGAGMFNLMTNATQVILQAIGGGNVAGDYNGDGMVNAADYVLWRDTLGSTSDLRADGDGSNTVDQGDFNFWRSQFGNSRSSGSGRAVPEPAGLALWSCSLIGLGCTLRRRAIN